MNPGRGRCLVEGDAWSREMPGRGRCLVEGDALPVEKVRQGHSHETFCPRNMRLVQATITRWCL
jgi:hypothetical protein